MREIDSIVLHHSADESTAKAIKNHHVNENGWSDIFYHFIIERDGKIKKGRNLARNSNRHRKNAIEICVIGKLHEREIYDVQKKSLEKLIFDLSIAHNIREVQGHNYYSNTICPASLDVDYFRNLIFKNKNLEILLNLDKIEELCKNIRGLLD